MTEEKLEQELGIFDFSLCHSVRESLLTKLLAMHRKDNAAQHSRKWAAARMDEDELDLVAAAGNGEGAGRILPKNGEEWNNKR
jgi:hypothetical protein